MRLPLMYCNVNFVDDTVSIGGYIKARICGGLKYNSMPKMILENGTTIHQTNSIARYIGKTHKGAKGEVLYPPPSELMQRYWVDVLLEKQNDFT